MGRLVTSADIAVYGAAIIANSQDPMVVNDYIIDHDDRNGIGNVFIDHALPMRDNGTIWIKGGLGLDGKGYGAIQIGENFPHTTSSTGINGKDILEGGNITFTVGTGLVFPVGNIVRVRYTSLQTLIFRGLVTSYSGSTLQLNSLTALGPFSSYTSTSNSSVNLNTSFSTSSTTNINLSTATAPLNITVGTGLSFTAGQKVKLVSTGATANTIIGTITSYTSGTGAMQLNPITKTGTATRNDWSVTLLIDIVTGTGLPYVASRKVQLISNGATANTLVGTVESYNSSTGAMSLLVQSKTGTATRSDWSVNIYLDAWQFAVETVKSSPTSPVRIQGFEGRVEVEYNGSRSDAFAVWNINNVVLDFETNSHPGMRDDWGSGRGGTFGFRFKSISHDSGDMGLKIDNALGTANSCEIYGMEMAQGGFALMRLSLSVNRYTKFRVKRNFFGRSFRGEGIYQGLTTAGPHPLHQNLLFIDNIMAFTAAEAIQLQQTGDGTRVSRNTIIGADHDWKSPFQPDQDTASQFELAQGDFKYTGNIFYAYGKNGLQLFARDMSSQGVPFGTGIPEVSNNSWSGTKRQLSMRTHSSFTLPSKLRMRNNDIPSALRIYDEIDVNRSFHYDMDGPVPVVQIGGNAPDDGYDLHNNTTDVIYFNINRTSVPEPEFVNSGFDGIDLNRTSKWHVEYTVGKYFASSASSRNPATLVDGGTTSFILSNSNGLILFAGYAPGDNVYIYSRGGGKSLYATVVSYDGGTGGTGTLSLNNISDRIGSGSAIDWNVAKRIPYTTSDFVWLMENGTSLPVELYRCKLAHDAHHDFRPDLDAVHWEKVWWDAAGKNQYDPLYDGVPVTTDYMEVAGDFRLVKGSYHHLLKRGIFASEQMDDTTMYGWQWKESESATEKNIPGAYDAKLVLDDYSYLRPGRYYRGWVERMNNTGAFTARLYSDWRLIT